MSIIPNNNDRLTGFLIIAVVYSVIKGIYIELDYKKILKGNKPE